MLPRAGKHCPSFNLALLYVQEGYGTRAALQSTGTADSGEFLTFYFLPAKMRLLVR